MGTTIHEDVGCSADSLFEILDAKAFTTFCFISAAFFMLTYRRQQRTGRDRRVIVIMYSLREIFVCLLMVGQLFHLVSRLRGLFSDIYLNLFTSMLASIPSIVAELDIILFRDATVRRSNVLVLFANR